MKSIVGSLLFVSGAARPLIDPHHTFRQHLALIKESGIQALNGTTTVGKSASAGSYMTQIFETPNCQKDSLVSASGYVYDQCLSIEGKGYVYSDCSQAGGKTTVHVSICSASDCSSGCDTFPVPVDTGCKTMSIMTCESSKTPWEELGLNTHMELYAGDTSCDGDFDQWTAINVDEDDCNDIECYRVDDYEYAMQSFCDSPSFRVPPVSQGPDEEACAGDIGAAASDIAKAGIDIAAAVEDCESGFTPSCNNDVDAVLTDLTSAAVHITAAVYDCGGGEPTACSADVNAVLADVTTATEAITDAVISCPVSNAKCAVDIAQAVVAIAQAAADIARAVEDC